MAAYHASASVSAVNGDPPRQPTPLQCVIAYNEYGAYCVPLASAHRPAARMIQAGQVWEPGTVAVLRAQCGTGDVIHAGTYFGDFLPAIGGALAPGARLWAFEPNRENHRCAAITIQLNDLANVVLHHAALGSGAAVARLRTIDAGGQALGGRSRIVDPEHPDEGGTEAVRIVAIDSVVPVDRHVSAVHLDVEGYEGAALAGALATIRRCRPLLVLEVLPGSDLITGRWFAEEILALGYEHAGNVHENIVFRATS